MFSTENCPLCCVHFAFVHWSKRACNCFISEILVFKKIYWRDKKIVGKYIILSICCSLLSYVISPFYQEASRQNIIYKDDIFRYQIYKLLRKTHRSVLIIFIETAALFMADKL
jgi:hypothetical protein